MEKYGEKIFGHTQETLLKKIIYYFINSKYRKSVNLQRWLDEQMDNISDEVYQYAAQIPNSDDYDEQMMLILKHVKDNFSYIGDSVGKWKMTEYWQTAHESVISDCGDCEDGHILMYVLARIKGIHPNRLTLFAGWVQSAPTAPQGGHCWLGYKAKNYPLNYCFLDWCYFYDISPINYRNKYMIVGDKIYGRKYNNNTLLSKYNSIWFGFNEEISFKEYNKK